MRGATSRRGSCTKLQKISIHAPHAGCDAGRRNRIHVDHISIHAPHAGCDYYDPTPEQARRDFNPRTPCGVRQNSGHLYRQPVGFQSTHPMRGATRIRGASGNRRADFNPRTPCGVRLDTGTKSFTRRRISIHAPHAGCDMNCETCGRWSHISIHAPHAGCDSPSARPERHPLISIHAPHAGCDFPGYAMLSGLAQFQSTHPMRGATSPPRL